MSKASTSSSSAFRRARSRAASIGPRSAGQWDGRGRAGERGRIGARLGVVAEGAGEGPCLGPEHPAGKLRPGQGQNAEERLLGRHRIVFSIAPSPSISTRTTSPGRRNDLRVAGLADAGRRAGRDDVPRLQREARRAPRDQLGDAEHHVGGRGVLARLAAHPRAHAERLGVGHLVGGRDPRPEGAERVAALGPRPLRLGPLAVARGDVVHHRVPEDVRERVGRGHVPRRASRSRPRARPRSRAPSV